MIFMKENLRSEYTMTSKEIKLVIKKYPQIKAQVQMISLVKEPKIYKTRNI